MSRSVAHARLAAHTLTHRFAEGRSAVRALHEGAHFALTEHSLYGLDAQASGANRFVVLRVTHEAANNLGSQAAQILLATDIEQGSYRNHFQAVPATARLLPPALSWNSCLATHVKQKSPSTSRLLRPRRTLRASPVAWPGSNPQQGSSTSS